MNNLTTTFQIHHILPIEVFNDTILSEKLNILMGDMGSNSQNVLQSYNNRIALFSDRQMADYYKSMQGVDNLWGDIPLGSVQHSGYHSNYNDVVKVKIISIMDDVRLGDDQKKTAIIDLQSTIKEGLISGALNLYDTEENLKSYIDQHTITTQQIIDQGDRYQLALAYEQHYLVNDSKHPEVKNDQVRESVDGKITGADNHIFLTDISKQIAEKALLSDIPLTDIMRQNLNNIISGDLNFLSSSIRTVIGHLVNAKMFVDEITTIAPSQIYSDFLEQHKIRYENNQKIDAFNDSLQKNNLSESERIFIQSEISRLELENITHTQEIIRISGMSEISRVYYPKSQAGYVDFRPLYDAFGNTANTIHTDIKDVIKNNILNVIDGEIRLNPHVSENFGQYLKDHILGGKVGAGVMAADFLNNTFDGLMQGIETGNWDKFEQQAGEYGPQAVVGTVLFAVGAELVPVIAGLLGVPVLGEVVLGGLLIWGAYEGGKAIGSLLYKLYDYTVDHDLSWNFGAEKVIQTLGNLSSGLSDKIAELFNLAQKLFRQDPLTLDLDKDGLETVGLSNTHSILFDHTGDGVKTNTGWIAPDDGFLVMDRNGNGIIDNGTELFGNSTPLFNGQIARDGFAALADQDSNLDGQVDIQDSNWLQLKVWRDLNQDGISQTNELFTLDQLEITGFKVSQEVHGQVLENQNEIVDLGVYYTAHGEASMGTIGQMADINLINDTFHREFIDQIVVTQEIKLLPEIKGSGKLHDLHEAMMLSPELKQLVEQFSQTDNYLIQRGLIKDIISAWAETDQSYQTIQQRAGEYTYITWSRIDDFKAYNHYTEVDHNGLPIYDQLWLNKVEEWDTKLKILEIFNGRYYFQLPSELGQDTGAIDGLDDYGIITIDGVEYQQYRLTIGDNHVATLQQAYENIVEGVRFSLLGQTRFSHLFELLNLQINEHGHITTDIQILSQYFQTKIIQQPVAGLAELTDFIQIFGKMFEADWTASMWQQWINHYYQLNLDEKNQLNEILEIVLDQSQLDANGYVQANPIVILENNEDQFLGIYDKAATVYSGLGNDHIRGGNGFNYYFNGGSGDDRLYGGNGNDILIGGEGNDQLNGGEGDDLLHGGLGDDGLDGDYGVNTYHFNRGDGQDTIQSFYLYPNMPSAETHIVLDVNKDEIIVQGIGNTAYIHIGLDKLTIENAFATNSILKSITFADQTIWTLEDIKTASLLGTGAANTIYGFDGRADLIEGRAGDDFLYGYSGNDILIGGEGDDELSSGPGNNFLDGGIGNDILRGGLGMDTYIFNRGYGQDTIYLEALTEDELKTEAYIQLGVLSSEIELDSLWATDLIIRIKNSTDQLQINDVFQTNTSFRALHFLDGTVWNIEDIKTQRMIGNEQNNYLMGYEDRNNIIYGQAGDDSLTGQFGHDQLYGGDGEDYLVGNSGDDLLDGGLGNDILDGGVGKNTYIFNRGYGQDEIYSIDINETTPLTETHIKLDVLASDIEFSSYWGSGLILKIKNTDDQLDIQAAFNELSAFRTITFADQIVWSLEDIRNQLLTGDEKNNSIIGFENRDNILYGFAGNDFLMGQIGNDQLYGGDGDDNLYGQEGNDRIYGGAGDDYFVGGASADTVVYQLLVPTDVLGGNSSDRWSDFTVGNAIANTNADKIDISDLLMDYNDNYDTASLDVFIKTVIDGSNTQIYIDRDGSGSTYSNSLLVTLDYVNTNLNDLINNQQILV